MADFMKKNYNISGSGVLSIEGDAITISVEDKGDFNLAVVLSELNGYDVKFSFSHDEDCGEVI